MSQRAAGGAHRGPPAGAAGVGRAADDAAGALFGDFAPLFADVGLPEASDAALSPPARHRGPRAVAAALGAPRGAGAPQRALPRAARAHAGALRREAPVRAGAARAGRGRRPHAPSAPASRPPTRPSWRRCAARLAATERGVIVCGPRDAGRTASPRRSRALAAATGYPVLAEAASQARYGGGPADGVALRRAAARTRPSPEAHRPGAGAALRRRPHAQGASQEWLDGVGRARWCSSQRRGRAVRPAHRAARVVEGSAVAACEALAAATAPRRAGVGRGASLVRAEPWRAAALEPAVSERPTALTEPRVAREVVAALPAGAHLFVVQQHAHPGRGRLRAVPGRARCGCSPTAGANGIDGIVSTALGVAAASGAPTVLLTGDLAFLHDVGGLLTARRHGLLAHGGGGEQRRGRHLLLPPRRR